MMAVKEDSIALAQDNERHAHREKNAHRRIDQRIQRGEPASPDALKEPHVLELPHRSRK
jgi:hypothetical protein